MIIFFYMTYEDINSQAAERIQSQLADLGKGIELSLQEDFTLIDKRIDSIFSASNNQIHVFASKYKNSYTSCNLIKQIFILDSSNKEIYTSSSIDDTLKSVLQKDIEKTGFARKKMEKYYVYHTKQDAKNWLLVLYRPLYNNHSYQGVVIVLLNREEMEKSLKKWTIYFRDLNFLISDQNKQIIFNTRDSSFVGCNRLSFEVTTQSNQLEEYYKEIFSRKSGSTNIMMRKGKSLIIAYQSVMINKKDFWVIELNSPYGSINESTKTIHIYIASIIVLSLLFVLCMTYIFLKERKKEMHDLQTRDLQTCHELQNCLTDANDELNLYKAILKTIFRYLDNPTFVILDIHGRIQSMSHHLLMILNYRNFEEIKGHPVEELFTSDELGNVAELLTTVRQKRIFSSNSISVHSKDRKTIVVELNASSLVDPEGNIIGIYIQFLEQSKTKEYVSLIERELFEDLNRYYLKRFEMIMFRLEAQLGLIDNSFLTVSERNVSTQEFIQIIDRNTRQERKSSLQKLFLNNIIEQHCSYWLSEKNINLKLDEKLPHFKGVIIEIIFLIDLVINYLDNYLLTNVRERQIATSFDNSKIYINFAFYGKRLRLTRETAKPDTIRIQAEKIRKRIEIVLKWYEADWHIKEIGEEEVIITVHFPIISSKTQFTREFPPTNKNTEGRNTKQD